MQRRTTTKFLAETMVGKEITALKKVNAKKSSKDL
jgi:hypothetical protein